jgi:ATP-dependent DNA helicase DinG
MTDHDDSDSEIIIDDVDLGLSNDSIHDYWPFKHSKPRHTQITALDWLEQIPSDKKYILCEIPVGGGKSPFALNVSSWMRQPMGDAFILTPQKILQRQYEASFDSNLVYSLYGKGNYECHSKNTNCDVGSSIKPKCEACPYKMANEEAAASPNMVLNYKLALLKFKLPPPFRPRPRKLMILDECHVLEGHLTEFNAVSVSEHRCKKLKIAFFQPHTIHKALEWLNTTYIPQLAKKYLELSDRLDTLNDELEFNPRTLSASEQALFKDVKELTEHLRSIDNLITMPTDEVCDRFVLVNEQKSFKFKEIYGRNVFHSLVKPMADRFLFMSATILNKEAFCRDLGLNPDEAAFISLPSEFPPENRPVVYIPQMKMNFEWNHEKNEEARKDLIVSIQQICQDHKAESGIIHTGNFQIAEWLVSQLNGSVPHTVVHHNPSAEVSRDDVIDGFMENSKDVPHLLISPSITEGLDLKDDSARFAIFAKVPFGNLGDAWVKKRRDISQDWYARQALIHIIQGGGRIVRAPTDYGTTYILDSSFAYLYRNNMRYVPEWWHEGYVEA